jgi:hypothetical protein
MHEVLFERLLKTEKLPYGAAQGHMSIEERNHIKHESESWLLLRTVTDPYRSDLRIQDGEHSNI